MKVIFTLISLIILQGCVSANLDGAFPSTEFIYSFVDGNGLPVSGVSLEVVNSDGALAYNYPIGEFTGPNSVISTSEGVLKFSHLNKGFEFAGECFGFGIFKYGACSAPEYTLDTKGKE